MLCSEEDWEIMSTLIPCSATAENSLAAIPGTPSIPRPSTVRRLRPLMEVMALTRAPLLWGWSTIRVEGPSGLNVFLIRMEIFRSTAGRMVLGWITLAPK